MMDGLTLIEYATHKADACACGAPREAHVEVIVTSFIAEALVTRKPIWTLGVDDKGRASWLWHALPVEEWDRMHATIATKILFAKLGLRR